MNTKEKKLIAVFLLIAVPYGGYHLFCACKNWANKPIEMKYMPSLFSSSIPLIVKTSPQTLKNNVSPKTKVLSVKFSEEMKRGYCAWCISSEKTVATPKTSGKKAVSFSNDFLTCSLKVKLKPDKIYGLTLNPPKHPTFRSKRGKVLPPYAYIFATANKDGSPTEIPQALIDKVNKYNKIHTEK